MQKQIVREINTGSWRSTEDYENIINMTNIYKIMKSTTIENGINRALATGDFSIKQSNSSKVGVAQVLNRLTYVSSLSHLRRINTPLEKSGELIAPRKLHNTTWGFLCLTGDTEVLLSDRVTVKQIKDLRDGDMVTTVNPDTLKDQPSDIHSFFSKMPDKLYAITTFSGRRIKATGNHPFLVNNKGKCEWKNLEDLEPNDKLVIRHTVKNIPDIDDTLIMIREMDAAEWHRAELFSNNLLNNHLPISKLKIFARLIGALNTSGHINENPIDGRKNYTATFFLREECDVYQLVDDMSKLGFTYPIIGRNPDTLEDKMTGEPVTDRTWTVTVNKALGYLLYLMGGFIDNKQHQKRYLPLWLSSSELSIKREYLSAIQGGTGWPIVYQKNEDDILAPHIEDTKIVTHEDYLDNTILYMSQISDMFDEFGIKSEVIAELHDDDVIMVKIAFDKSPACLARYSDIIGYTYCDEKRRLSAPAIEHIKIRAFIPIKINARRGDMTSMVTRPKVLFKEDVIFEEFEEYYRDNVLENGCISVPIMAITALEPELVYDFTTRSDNHSFVAASFVTHNCPAETPEGQSIGIVKNISYLGHITIPTNSSSLYEYVKPYVRAVGDVDPHKLYGKVKVFVNGAWVGISENPLELYNDMKEKKYKGIVNIYTSIIFDFKDLEIRICNDGGRLTRPVLRVKDNKALITDEIIERLAKKEISWNDLLTNCKLPESVIEYIDPEEQKFSMIAMKCKDAYLQDAHFKFQYTHCEIHPSTIFGVLASCIPFPEHNQAPRNTYQCAMGKQAIGVYATNYDQRMDKTAYVLNYPSRPLVDTRVMNFIHLNKIPSGTQIHVAIMTHTGYNQEDSVLINKGSIDRGLFMATIYHTEKDEDKNIIRDEIIRCKPDPTKTKGIKFGNYDKLMSNGFIPENSIVENRDVIIAKTIPIKENRNDPTKTIKYEDQSKTFRTTEETYIDKNYTGRNGDGYNFAKVRVRTLRKPVLGDKFSSRHGQKGTIGNIIPECDMPFTKNGLRPDIIINPHAIPSRMTIGQLKETLLGKVLLELGMFGDGTSFGNLDVKTISTELQKLGYESYGNELMYNGLTGEQLETNIYIGPVFYQRLKHMVNDKQHSRSIGPMVNLTRQPAEGRSRDGGFRIGEMERDVMIAHGMTRFCKERLYDVSDKYSVHVCKKCGMIASYNDGNKNKMYAHADFSVHLCKTCNNMTDFVKVDIPYAYKLMAQELQTINIVPRLITE